MGVSYQGFWSSRWSLPLSLMAVAEPQKIVSEGIFKLKPVKDCSKLEDARPIIYLYDAQQVTLGRNRLTNIRDLSLSRKQLRIEANATGDCVEVTQLSSTQPSFVNGQPLLFPWSKMLVPGDSISLCKNSHEYVLERSERSQKTTSPDDLNSPSTKKRKHTEEQEAVPPKTPLQNEDFRQKASNKEKRRSAWSPMDLVQQLCVFSSGGKPVLPRKSLGD
ncbi:hypothetical protein RvY_05771 [Ramazzottius varieornatus]|uniref:PNK FHA domain-containing protein n=1 Tax=Ramazzottius varieornatus TaxID=947166 RepID=A0A1D1V5W9_RAMVA|nr:hypothetical protein RvY_05771 [Ramazzottius varieornatus]